MSFRPLRRAVRPFARASRVLLVAALAAAGVAVPSGIHAHAQLPTPGLPRGDAAADASPAEPDRPARPAYDPSDRSTPRRAVNAFLVDARRGDYAEAARALDLSDLPAAERVRHGAELARQLKVVLDQFVWFEYEAISDAPEGDVDDDQPAGVDKVGEVPFGGGTVDILLDRDDAGGAPRWRFADGTVARIPALYEEHGRPWVEEYLPAVFHTWRFLEIELWQWLGLLLLVPGAIMAGRLLARVLRRPLEWFARRSSTELDDHLVAAFIPPFRVFLAIAVFRVAVVWLGLSVPATRAINLLAGAVGFLNLVWFVVRLINLAGALLEHRFRETGPQSMLAVVPLARRTMKGVLYLIAFLVVLQNFGVKVTGLLAGVGVVGLAVSLAAQKTIENLFGGLSLIVDQPVRVGDFCRFGALMGIVEDIGIRSTRVRTLDRTLISVPNSQFSTEIIENFGSRDLIRFFQVINLRYETTPDQLRAVLAELRRLFTAHPMVDQATTNRVRFVNFGASSLDVEIYVYVKTTDFNVFLAVKEDLMLRMMEIVQAAGTGFAFPSQTLYLGRDAGPDAERARAAEARVAEWRRSGRLPFPDADPAEAAAVRDTLDYPPEGSVARTGSILP